MTLEKQKYTTSKISKLHVYHFFFFFFDKLLKTQYVASDSNSQCRCHSSFSVVLLLFSKICEHLIHCCCATFINNNSHLLALNHNHRTGNHAVYVHSEQWRSQNAKKVTHIKGRLLDKAVVLFKLTIASLFKMRTSFKGKNLLPEGANSFL